ncbi:Alpha/Beta hydrolase protein [Fusarium flagelliforme]|uniref:Alpha/Beta hydrolase protein n=1 Tax=Fusarium flagelliforme TaxID=2675880 RepID=UPI001E8D80F6|nr:Alpha/Beta hydrolase protein [Fusarium flagelliforme]KAH7184546.1 Alpha/Beta hydrolase protein [Fusarium flagelliforme]
MMSSWWSSVPWVDSGSSWHKHRVPYLTNATYLHTLDIWAPKTAEESSIPTEDYIPDKKGPWIIYIHGGAWRDPLVDSSSFEATALKLLQDQDTRIAGIASINYPLSSHPNHPTHPAPPKDPTEPIDVARTAKHPDHIISVLSAIAYLQEELGVAHDYVLSGHSCGATLAFQAVMNADRWATAGSNDSSVPRIKKPSIIAPLNGLYDLAAFIDNPPDSHKALQPLYLQFTKNAFGDNAEVWKAACPTVVSDWMTEWPEGKAVFIAQSREDTLVPYSQTELMRGHLQRNSKLEIIEMPASGDHNDLWKQADEIVEIMKQAIDYATRV